MHGCPGHGLELWAEGHTGACDGISRRGQPQSFRTTSHRCQPSESERDTELESLRKRGLDCTTPGPGPHPAIPGFQERKRLLGWVSGLAEALCGGETSEGGPPGFLTIACVPVTSSHLRGRGEAGSKRL